MDRANERLEPVERRLKELIRSRDEIKNLDGQLGAMRSRKQQMVEDREKLKKRIKQEFLVTCFGRFFPLNERKVFREVATCFACVCDI